ncbi:MAG: glycosyltransferase family 39 protein [Acidobacteria bacterium]|nr:glycosyltransferase family 39 protein [Acidobacteriota bacterium]
MPKIKSSTAWALLWPVWIVLTLALTAGPFLWHLEYFHHPGPQFFSIYLGMLAVLGLVSAFYLRLRQARPAIIVWEPRAIAIFFLAFFLFYAPLPALYALWIGFICFSIGRLMLQRLTESALEQLTLWPAAGLGLLSAALFCLGLARLYYRWLAVALLALAALVLWRNAARVWQVLRRIEAGYVASAGGPLWGLCLVFVFVVSLSSAMVALSPEIAFDPVSFHFVLAREYAARHELAVIPYIPYSYFPQNVEVLYTLGFLLEGQATAKLLSYAFFPLAAMTVLLIGRRWFSGAPSESGPLVGAALFWTTPFISWTGSVAKNDLALALYLLLALYAVLRWSETRRFGWLAAAALFLGFSFGVKHVAVLGAVPLGLLILWQLRANPIRWRQALGLAAIFACAGLFWHARTFVLAGNPLYPEYGASAVRSTTAAGHPQLSRLERLRVYVSFPWTMHFRGLHVFESPSPNPLGFALLAFWPLFWWPGGIRSRTARLALWFALGYLLYWAAVLVKVRYAIAAFGVLFACLGDRLSAYFFSGNGARSALRRASILALATYCLLFSLSLTLILEMNVPRLKLFARRIDREQFLRQSLVTYPTIEALNRAARPGEVAYSVGNCSTFYSHIEFHCYFDEENNYSFRRMARELGATHYNYLIVSAEWARHPHMRGVEHYYHPQLLYHDQYFYLYRLRRL